MSFRKRDFACPRPGRSDTKTRVILRKNDDPLYDSTSDRHDSSVSRHLDSDRFWDASHDAFCSILELAESQGVPVLQFVRFPDFLNFLAGEKQYQHPPVKK